MKYKIFILMVGLIPLMAISQDEIQVPELRINPVTIGAEQLKMEATGPTDRLRYREIEALELSTEWQDKYSESYLGDGGRVVYHYGETSHTVVCSPLNVCDIELQAGEVMRPPQLGDTVRWIVTLGESGPAGNEVPHVYIKPKSANLTTTMVVPTNRRTYRFQLKSVKDKYMAVVSFAYPEDMQANWLAYQLANQEAKQNTVVEVEGINWDLADLNFDYRVSGDKPKWKPVRVFNNGLKTVIQMPYAMKQTEAPAFLVLDESGEEQIVNYRVRNDRYIVDKVFDRGILITGVGKKQTKVVVSREASRTYAAEQLREPYTK